MAAHAATVHLTWEATTQRASIGRPVDWVGRLIQTYEAEHPDIQIDYALVSRAKYLTQILGGVGPDIIEDDGDGFREAGLRGSFADLTPDLGTDLPDYMAQQLFWPPEWGAFSNQGVQFALPRSLATGGLYINQDLWEAAGLVLPPSELAANTMTWADFAVACRKLTLTDAFGDVLRPAFGLSYAPEAISPWLRAAGAQYYQNGSHSQSALGSPATVDALNYLQDLAYGARCLTEVNSPSLFLQGRLPIYQSGSWDLDQVLGTQLNGQSKTHFAVQVLPMPLGPAGQRAALARLDGFAVANNSAHPEAARQFLAFLVGPEANALRAKLTGLQPARRDVLPGYLNLMDATNPQAVRIQARVFAEAGPYAYPLYVYSNQGLAQSVIGEALRDILGRRAYVFGTWSDAIRRLNAGLQNDPYAQRPHPATPLAVAGDNLTAQDIGTVATGQSSVSGAAVQTRAAGAGISGAQDRFHYVYRAVRGDFTVRVHLTSLAGSPDAVAGLMLRGDLSAGSPNVALLLDKDGALTLQARAEEYAPTGAAQRRSVASTHGMWLRLQRQADEITASTSADGVTWTAAGRVRLPMAESILAGVAVASGDAATPATVDWGDWQVVAADTDPSASRGNFRAERTESERGLF